MARPRFKTAPITDAYTRATAGVTRRDLLKLIGAAGAAALATPVVPGIALAQPVFGDYPFTLGVASGDPLPSGVVLWTRLAPRPLEGGGMPMRDVEVKWEVAADDRFRTIVQQGTSIARPELGHAVHVEVDGLSPSRDYYYRFFSGSEVSQTGRIRTAPAPGARVDALRFAVCGCSHYEVGFFTAYRHLADENLDFVFHTGDYIYEYRADGGRDASRVRQHHGDEIYTIVDYRNRYAQYKLDPDLAAAHRSAPFVLTWDDHEVDNNYAGDHDEHGTPKELFLLRRAAAYQAYHESMPLRAAQLPHGPDMRLYRRLQFGSLIDLSVLDTRQFRSPQACGDGSHTGCAEADLPTRTIMGDAQERWLFENLASARSTWTLLGQQVPTFARDASGLTPDGQFSMDKWDGYTASRQRLYTRLQETKAPNPIVLSGDVHLHFGSDLKADYREPKSATVGVEFTNSSITSNGDGSETQAGWDCLQADNPHIRYHGARRGYISCTATPATMRADFKSVDRVTVPDAPVRTTGALVVEAGRPGASKA
ncbi:MAG: alkaline phosphatase D family protein [Vicinamibacterales bacterium]